VLPTPGRVLNLDLEEVRDAGSPGSNRSTPEVVSSQEASLDPSTDCPDDASSKARNIRYVMPIPTGKRIVPMTTHFSAENCRYSSSIYFQFMALASETYRISAW